MENAKNKIDILNSTNSRLIFIKLVLFSLPIILSKVLQQVGNVIDSMVVGNLLGKDSLAAISVNSTLVNLLTTFFVGFSIGISVVVAQSYGAKDHDKVGKAIHTSVALSLIIGVLLIIIGICFSDDILLMMNTPPDIMPLSTLYLKVYFIGGLFIVGYNTFSGILYGMGDSKRPLIYLCTSTTLNLVLDILFVSVFKMDIVGIAWAGLISKTVLFIFPLIRLMTLKNDYRLSIKKISFDLKLLKKIVLISLPMGIQSSLFSFSNVLLLSKINLFGSTVISGWGIGARIDSIISAILNSVSLALTTVVGRYYGAKNYNAIKISSRVSIFLIIGMSIIIGICIILLGRTMARAFTNESEVIEYAYLILNRIGIFYVFLAIPNTLVGTIRGTGKAVLPLIINIICILGVRTLWIMIVPLIWSNTVMQLNALIFTHLISWLILTASVVVYYLIYMNKKIYSQINKQVIEKTC